MSTEEVKITWEDFDRLCKEMALRIWKEYQPDIIVGVVNAGVLPGVIMSNLFQKDFYTIKLSRRKAGRIVRDHPTLFVPVTDSVHNKKVLLVDEICITGETLTLAKEATLNKLASEVKTCALFVRSDSTKPDWFALQTDAKIVAPWNHYVINEEGALEVNPEL